MFPQQAPRCREHGTPTPESGVAMRGRLLPPHGRRQSTADLPASVRRATHHATSQLEVGRGHRVRPVCRGDPNPAGCIICGDLRIQKSMLRQHPTEQPSHKLSAKGIAQETVPGIFPCLLVGAACLCFHRWIGVASSRPQENFASFRRWWHEGSIHEADQAGFGHVLIRRITRTVRLPPCHCVRRGCVQAC